MTSQTRALVTTIVAGAALLAALWFVVIAPKHAERSEVRASVTTQQARLDAATAQVTAYTASQKQFEGLLSELRRLDVAVPARGAVSTMLRELQRRAKVRGSELRLVALRDGAGAAPETPSATPGAVAGPGGLSALAFTFEYTGRYFDLVDILATVRRSVRAKDGDLKISGRLLTVDGLAFERVNDSAVLTKAVINATAYIAPDGASAPEPPADPAQAPAKGGS